MITQPVGTDRRPAPRLQGEPGIWIVVALDTVAFCVLFGMFLVLRAEQPEVFTAGHDRVSPWFGAANTVILLVSSVVLVGAVAALRADARREASRLFGVVAALGALFVVAKVGEWSWEVARGFTPRTDDFFMLYYGLTGLHLFHVLIGIAVLTASALRLRRRALEVRESRMLESGATFWHMVDLIWLLLFPIVYLVG